MSLIVDMFFTCYDLLPCSGINTISHTTDAEGGNAGSNFTEIHFSGSSQHALYVIPLK